MVVSKKISQRKLEAGLAKKWLKMLYKKGVINGITYQLILEELRK